MIYAVEHYILIGLYTFLLVLVIVNIWTILIKQRRYKTLPLLAFYIFTLLNIVFRLVFIIIRWSKYHIVKHFFNDSYLVTKLSVGLIQSWMIFEIALRERHAYKASSFSPAKYKCFGKWMRCGQYSTIVVATAIVLAILIYDLLHLHERKDDHNSSFPTIAYSYLGMFFLMSAVNILLICVLRERKRVA